MARLKEIDDEPITQFGSQVDRVLTCHILALEREYNTREACQQVDETLKHIPVARPKRQSSDPAMPFCGSACRTWTMR